DRGRADGLESVRADGFLLDRESDFTQTGRLLRRALGYPRGMSDRSSAAHRAARAAAVALSLGLFAFVIINAQFGCDAPATNAPPQEAAGQAAKQAEPAAEPKPEPTTEPASVDDVAQPPAEPST